MWFIRHLGVKCDSKSSACSSTPCAIFGPVIIFRHDVTKSHILNKVSLRIFHDVHSIIKTIKMTRNKWIGAIWTSIFFNSDFFELWW